MDYASGSDVIIRVYNVEEEGKRESQRKQCEGASSGQRHAIGLQLKREKGARGQGMSEFSIRWHRQVNEFSLETTERNIALLMP